MGEKGNVRQGGLYCRDLGRLGAFECLLVLAQVGNKTGLSVINVSGILVVPVLVCGLLELCDLIPVVLLLESVSEGGGFERADSSSVSHFMINYKVVTMFVEIYLKFWDTKTAPKRYPFLINLLNIRKKLSYRIYNRDRRRGNPTHPIQWHSPPSSLRLEAL